MRQRAREKRLCASAGANCKVSNCFKDTETQCTFMLWFPPNF